MGRWMGHLALVPNSSALTSALRLAREYTCTHIHMQTCTRTHIHIEAHKHVHVHTLTHNYTEYVCCTHTRTCTLRARMWGHVRAHTYTYRHVRTHVHMYMSTHRYFHTHTSRTHMHTRLHIHFNWACSFRQCMETSYFAQEGRSSGMWYVCQSRFTNTVSPTQSRGTSGSACICMHIRAYMKFHPA